MRDTFDITPQQYHAGLDKLWDALGLTGVQDEDVFTLAARAIRKKASDGWIVDRQPERQETILWMTVQGVDGDPFVARGGLCGDGVYVEGLGMLPNTTRMLAWMPYHEPTPYTGKRTLLDLEK